MLRIVVNIQTSQTHAYGRLALCTCIWQTCSTYTCICIQCNLGSRLLHPRYSYRCNPAFTSRSRLLRSVPHYVPLLRIPTPCLALLCFSTFHLVFLLFFRSLFLIIFWYTLLRADLRLFELDIARIDSFIRDRLPSSLWSQAIDLFSQGGLVHLERLSSISSDAVFLLVNIVPSQFLLSLNARYIDFVGFLLFNVVW